MPGRKTYVGTATETTLAAGINSTDTTITLADGSTYGSPSVAAPMVIVVGAETPSEEQILISARSSNVLTVAASGRNWQAGGGTTGVAHALGEVIRHVLDADSIDDANRHVNTDADDDHSQYLTSARFVTAHDVEARHAFGAALGAPGTPAAIGTGAASAGTGDDAAREDHVHNHNPPACRVSGAQQAIAHTTQVVVAFDTDVFDTAAMHDTATNNSRITFPTAGIYEVGFTGKLDSGTDYTALYASLRLNGSAGIDEDFHANPATTDSGPRFKLYTVYKFAAADYVEVLVYHRNSAAASRNLQSIAGSTPFFWAVWLGTG